MILIIVSQAFDISDWKPYTFKEKEYFKYEIVSKENDGVKKGTYEISIDGKKVTIDGEFDGLSGNVSFEAKSSKQVPSTIMGMMIFNPWLAPLGATIFAQAFMGMFAMYGNMKYKDARTDVEIISGQKSCEFGGVSGKLFQIKKNNRIIYESCLSKEVGLPLYIKTVSENGEVYEAKLVEHR